MNSYRLSKIGISILFMFTILLSACGSAAEPSIIGTWTTTVSKEDLIRVEPEFPEEFLCDNAGTFIWAFNEDGTFTIDQTLLPDCTLVGTAHIEDVWVLDGKQLTFAKGTSDEEIYEIAINGDQLTFKVVASECPPCIAINTANPWTRVE